MKSTIASNKDLLDLLERLTNHARILGDDAIPSAIDDGLHTGMTTSEQLGGTRSALALVRQKLDDRYPAELRSQVDEAIVEIDRWFAQVNRGIAIKGS